MSRRLPIGTRARPEAVAGWLVAAVMVVVVYVVVVRGGDLLVGTAAAHVELSILATVIVAATIERVQRYGERVAARWMGREHQNPYDVLARFSSRAAAAEAAGELPQLMARLLSEGTSAAWAQVWLLVNGRPTLMATHPAEAMTMTATMAAPPSIGGAVDESTGVRGVAVGHGGRVLAVLRLRERDGQPLTAVEERLFAGLAAQSGLALHSAQVRAELEDRHRQLTARTAQLHAARNQLVAAQDTERRRLERDIHDGAQQQLVALRINLRLVQTVADRAPERARQLIVEQERAVVDAIATVRALSRGADPEVLVRDGLAEALRIASTSCPLPVSLDLHDVGRFSRSVETAVYYCCLEALQNTVKHAEADTVSISLSLTAGALQLEVVDDGRGVQPGAARGAGLVNMRERLEAVGGTLRVGAASGSGTSVVAVVPVDT